MEGSRFLKYSNERFSAHNERGMAPLPVDPAAAVKLWLKAADSEQTSEKWSRVQRAACKVPWLRSLTECGGLPAACCTEAAQRCIEGKDGNLLPLVEFLFRGFDHAELPVATGQHCIRPLFPSVVVVVWHVWLCCEAALAAYMTYRAGCRIPPLEKEICYLPAVQRH